MPIPPKVQTVLDEVQSFEKLAAAYMLGLGDKKTASQAACLHLASWTFKHCNAAIILAEYEAYANPAITLLRPAVECQERAIYLANLLPPERDTEALKFLQMRELVKAVRSETLLNNPEEMAYWRAIAPATFPLEENCKKIVAEAKAKFSDNPPIKTQLFRLEKYWGFRKVRERSLALPVHQDTQAPFFKIEPFWEEACLSVHGGTAAYLTQPKPENIYDMGLKMVVGTAFSVALVTFEKDIDYKNTEAMFAALKAYQAEDAPAPTAPPTP